MKFKNILQIVIGAVLFIVLAFVSWKVFMDPISSEALTVEEAEKVATERFNGDVEDSKLNNDQYEITLKLDTGIYQINVASDSGEVLDVKRIKKEKPKKELAKEEIKEIIEQKQIGEIEDIHEKEDNKKKLYEAIVKNEQEKVYLTLDGETGEILEQEEEKLQTADKENTSESTEPDNSSNKEEEKPEQSGESEEKSQNLTTEEAVQIALDTVYGEVDDIDLEDEDGQQYYFIEIETDDDQEAEIQIHAITGEVISIEWDD